MAVSEGPSDTFIDPALTSALSEMEAEGFDPNAPVGDLDAVGDSQPESVASAPAKEAAPPTPAGDSGAAVVAPVDPVVDPFAGTEPYTYGEGKTALDGVYRVPGEGLLIPEDKVAAFDAFTARTESLERILHSAAQDRQVLDRLSEWKTTGPDGKEQTLTGQQGLVEMRLQVARQAVEIGVYESLFQDPAKIVQLLAQDAQGNWVLDPERLESLAYRAKDQMRAAEDGLRRELGARINPPAQQQALDTAKYAPSLIDQAAGAQKALLTPEDRTFLSQHLARYVRDVRPGEQGLNGKIVDGSFAEFVNQIVTKNATAKASAEKSEAAGKFNAGQEKGRAAPPKQKPTAPPAKAASATKEKPQDKTWDAFETAMQELDIPVR